MNNDLPVYSTKNVFLAKSVYKQLNKWVFGSDSFYVQEHIADVKSPFYIMFIDGLTRTASIQNTVADFAAGIAFVLEQFLWEEE